MGNRGALGADAAPPRAWQAASSSPCASHASGDAHGTIALLTLLRRVAIGAGVLGVLGVLLALKAHASTVLTLLATQVHSAGAWGVAGYVAAFAAPSPSSRLVSGAWQCATRRTSSITTSCATPTITARPWLT